MKKQVRVITRIESTVDNITSNVIGVIDINYPLEKFIKEYQDYHGLFPEDFQYRATLWNIWEEKECTKP